MRNGKQSPGGNPPALQHKEEAPAQPKEVKKAFDPERCTLEEMHRATTIQSPFLA